MTWHRFVDEPAVGTMLMADGQRFDLVRVEPYERKTDGMPSRLLTWAGRCADCGEPIEVQSGLIVSGLRRRCDLHKAPLRPVARGHGKVAVVVSGPVGSGAAAKAESLEPLAPHG